MTWKADGTRYNMLLLKYGAYLVDRSGEVRPHIFCVSNRHLTQSR
jgi:hypothetical protein